MSAGKRNILALNCGSSSLKFGLYESDGVSAAAILEGEAEEIGSKRGRFSVEARGSPKASSDLSFPDPISALSHAFELLKARAASRFDAIGHRFVHGGPLLREHTRLDAAVLGKLEAAVEYAPLHMPSSLAVLKAAAEKYVGVPQVICLDTAFHRHMPDVSRTYALPESIRQLGLERYGFHGLSLESILGQLNPVPARLVIAHLGNGASVTAIRGGISIDTSMGLTPTGGVIMGTRCGDLDPGLMIYLMRHGYAGADELERVCDRESGLLGVSGVSSDVRELLSRRGTDAQADLALRMFCYQVRKTVAEMAAALEGIDALVFTGGIGEHNQQIREEIYHPLAFLPPFEVRVLPSQEDEQIARNTARLIRDQA